MPAVPAPPSEPADQARTYVVLKQGESPKDWTEVEEVEAATDQQAIKNATTGASREGTFVAVPARSWRPRTPKIEKVEKDVWS